LDEAVEIEHEAVLDGGLSAMIAAADAAHFCSSARRIMRNSVPILI
jgi:hypothetical protein